MLSNLINFIFYCVFGAFLALGYMFYEMFWLSTQGKDKVSQCAKLMGEVR